MTPAYLVCLHIVGNKTFLLNSSNLCRHTYRKSLLLLTPRGYLKRPKFSWFHLVNSLKRHDVSPKAGEKFRFLRESKTVENLHRAYHLLARTLELLKGSSDRALVPFNQLNSYFPLLEDLKSFFEQLKFKWKFFLLKSLSLERSWREKLRSNVRIATWKVTVSPRFLYTPRLPKEIGRFTSSRTLSTLFARNGKGLVDSIYRFPAVGSNLVSNRQTSMDDEAAISVNSLNKTNSFNRTYDSKLIFKPSWRHSLLDKVRVGFLTSFMTRSQTKLTKLWTEPTLKVHSLLYWQVETTSDQESIPHHIHFRWKHYPKRLRQRRMMRGTHLSISSWNKALLTFSVVILRSATDTLWFILRPVLIEGFHVLYYSIQVAFNLVLKQKVIQGPSKGELQHVVSKNSRDGISLDSTMKDVILWNFSSFWKMERTLSKIARKTILWGVVEEDWLNSNDRNARESNAKRKELLTGFENKNASHSYFLTNWGVLEWTGIVFVLFVSGFSLFFFSDSLVDACTFVFQLFAVYSVATFSVASWRIMKASPYFGRLYEAINGYISILLRYSFITGANESEVVDVAAWEVDDEWKTYSLCRYLDELWEEGICRAESTLRRIPVLVMDSSVKDWQLLSLFEQEDDKGNYGL